MREEPFETAHDFLASDQVQVHVGFCRRDQVVVRIIGPLPDGREVASNQLAQPPVFLHLRQGRQLSLCITAIGFWSPCRVAPPRPHPVAARLASEPSVCCE